MDEITRELICALAEPILRDLARRCSDTEGGAEADDPAQRWAMAGARIAHDFQNPFVDAAALLADLGVLTDETAPRLLISAAELPGHFAGGDGAARLAEFAADRGRVERLVLCYAEFANWYWQPSLPMGPEPFDDDVTLSPAIEALIEAEYVEAADGALAWSRRFGLLVTRHQRGAHGWPIDLGASKGEPP